MKKIKSALISVYHKDGLDNIINFLYENNVTLYSTGGTLDFIRSLGAEGIAVETLTGYPSILNGRVKTLHPAVFGGILTRRGNEGDKQQCEQYGIPEIDLVIVDLYPFQQTVENGGSEAEIIEKIDIGGISLIRGAAKNFNDVVIVGSSELYGELLSTIKGQDCSTTIEQRRRFAAQAFMVSSDYDTAIFNYFNRTEGIDAFKVSQNRCTGLRYGENPHQSACFCGDIDKIFTKHHGKELSYNNLLDLDAAVSLISEFKTQPAFAILKHNNACGLAVKETLAAAWETALSCDPVSAFGGVLICNRAVDAETAREINKLFFEVIAAPGYEQEALETLQTKKNRIILSMHNTELPKKQFRSLLNGAVVQDRDTIVGGKDTELKFATNEKPSNSQMEDLLFANTIVKHSKSNAIVLAKDNMLLSSGIGQTSRVDALRQAIAKAKSFGFDLNGAVMASDAYFPFADCVEIAHGEGINAVIQPGGSVRDQDSIDYCNNNGISMVFTGARHFKH